MRARHPATLGALALLLLALNGCEFESAKGMAPIEMNSCASSASCESGSVCKNSLCVAESADGTLDIALQVTPLSTSSGAAPLPIMLAPFKVSQPVTRPFDLRELTEFNGQVVDQGRAIDASVTFTPTQMIPGIAARPVTALVAVSAVDYTVQLLSGVEYRMVVLPTDMRLPPYLDMFVAGDVGRRDVNFETLETREQTLTITGAAADRDLLVTALDQVHGEPISSTATVIKGKATLLFARDTQNVPFRLQIRAAQSYDDEPALNAMNAMPCDSDTPAFPSFSINDTDIERDDADGLKIELPKLQERIRYEGTVELCAEEQGNESAITALPVTLQSQSLRLDDGSALSASFDATTSATYDKATGSLRFCVQVLPGEYAVRATPPATTRCALFAEHMPIEAPKKGEDASRGVLLSLPTSAFLAGKVLTSASMPLSNATIEAHALGRPDAVELPHDDRSVTSYNRSSETLTDSAGAFKLPVDLGSYDVVIKPLIESGFPWQVRTDVGVGLGARNDPAGNIIDMPSPVVVSGTLRYPRRGEKAQATLSGAEIEAYALVDDGNGGKRAVTVGKAVADDNGQFMLLLPRSVPRGWELPSP